LKRRQPCWLLAAAMGKSNMSDTTCALLLMDYASPPLCRSMHALLCSAVLNLVVMQPTGRQTKLRLRHKVLAGIYPKPGKFHHMEDCKCQFIKSHCGCDARGIACSWANDATSHHPEGSKLCNRHETDLLHCHLVAFSLHRDCNGWSVF